MCVINHNYYCYCSNYILIIIPLIILICYHHYLIILLGGNSIGVEGAKALAVAIKEIKSLTDLNLRNKNNFAISFAMNNIFVCYQ